MFCPFSNFNNLLGVPNKGIHSYRFGYIAIVDYVLSILLASVLSYICAIPLDLMTIFVFIIALLLHLLFGVNTATINYLGLSC